MEHKDCIVCVICKQELHYIKEFVEYHLNLGFDRIIIGDNNDVDGERYDDILKEYIDTNKVIIVDLRGKKCMQMPFYNSILKNYDYKWCAFIDCDEFLTFSDESKYNNIKDFLDSNDNITNYHVQWKMYGDNGIIDNNGDYRLVDRFVEPLDLEKNRGSNQHIKTILNYKDTGRYSHCDVGFYCNPHTVLLDDAYSPNGTKVSAGPFNLNFDYDVLYIKHFYTKSLNEWMENKMSRGCPDSLKFPYTLDVFKCCNGWDENKENFYKIKKDELGKC